MEWSVLAFWLFGAFFTYLVVRRLPAEERKKAQRQEELIAALFHLPGLSVLYDLDTFYKKVSDILKDVSKKDRIELGQRIRHALVVVAEMAQTFANHGDHIGMSYGANIMLIVRKGDDEFYSKAHEILRFAHKNTHPPGLLILHSDIIVNNLPDQKSRVFPMFSVPVVVTEISNETDYEIILPGAATALLTGDPSIHEDTYKLADECKGLGDEVVRQVRSYFNKDGDGSAVRSFAAFRIGDGDNAIGVLNIDTNVKGVLGKGEVYYSTFGALIQPLLRILEPAVRRYDELWRAEGMPFGPAEGATIEPPTAPVQGEPGTADTRTAS